MHVGVCVCVCVCVASSEALPIPVVCLQYNKILASFPGLHPGVRRPGNEANRIPLLDLITISMAYNVIAHCVCRRVSAVEGSNKGDSPQEELVGL